MFGIDFSQNVRSSRDGADEFGLISVKSSNHCSVFT